MKTETSIVARQYRLMEWAEQIRDCKARPSGMSVAEWCVFYTKTEKDSLLFCGFLKSVDKSSGVVGRNAETQVRWFLHYTVDTVKCYIRNVIWRCKNNGNTR